MSWWRRERRLDAELQFHIEEQVREYVRSGISEEAARRKAMLAFGGLDQIKEECRDARPTAFLEQIVRDAQLGARVLQKTPLFTLFVTLILSIGIGANVIVFTYVNALFLKTRDIPEPKRLVKIYHEGYSGSVSYPIYLQYRERSRAFEEVGTYYVRGHLPIRIQPSGTLPLDLIAPAMISGNLFKAIGVRPVIGRAIEPEDERDGFPNVVMLDQPAWKKYFPAEADIVGKTVFLNNVAYTIIGIAPKSFQDVLDITPLVPSPHLYIPLRNADSSGVENGASGLVGRLRHGISLSEAQADLSRIDAQIIIDTYHRAYDVNGRSLQVAAIVQPNNSLPPRLRVELSAMMAIFMIAVLAVLLIACDDIAILMLARIVDRQREMAIRVALGASRAQLIRQLLAENLLLSMLGGMGAMIFVLITARVIERLPFPLPLPDTGRATFDWQVLLFTTGLSFATTMFFGLRPALQCVRKDVVASIAPGTASAPASQTRARSNLVMTQVAVCTCLLITAGVLVRSGQVDLPKDLGFHPDHILAGRINFIGSGYDRETQLAFYDKLLNRLKETPGIVAACIVADRLPMTGNGLPRTSVVHADSSDAHVQVETAIVGMGHFETLRIPIIHGRDFTARDDSKSGPVAIVNQAMSRRLWGTDDPVGRTIIAPDNLQVEVIGVVRDIKYRYDEQEPAPLLYLPMRQQLQKFGTTLPNGFLIRTIGEPMAATTLALTKIAEIDRNLFAYEFGTMEDRMGRELTPVRIFAYVVGIPGMFALLLGVIGTYGTMATVVSQRRREIGIRIALGAQPPQAVRLIMKEGMMSAGIGLTLGVVGAFLIALWLNQTFYGLHFANPFIFAATTILIGATAATACYIPSKKASGVDPIVVLRED